MKYVISLSGLSPILFHKMSINAAAQAFREGHLVASPIQGTSADADSSIGSKKKLFFLSTTRSRDGAYHRRTPSSNVLLTLDGRKLAQRYSGSPTDYWQIDTSPSARASGDEMEDRVYTDDPKISLKYVTQVDILIDRYGTPKAAWLNAIMLGARKYGIKVRVFDDPKQWLYGRKESTKPLRELVQPVEKNPSRWAHNRRRDNEDMVSGAYEMLVKAQKPGFDPKRHPDGLTAAGKYAYTRIVINSQDADMLQNEAHNAMRKVGSYERKKLDRLLQYMKRHGFKTFRELTQHLQTVYNKWR